MDGCYRLHQTAQARWMLASFRHIARRQSPLLSLISARFVITTNFHRVNTWLYLRRLNLTKKETTSWECSVKGRMIKSSMFFTFCLLHMLNIANSLIILPMSKFLVMLYCSHNQFVSEAFYWLVRFKHAIVQYWVMKDYRQIQLSAQIESNKCKTMFSFHCMMLCKAQYMLQCFCPSVHYAWSCGKRHQNSLSLLLAKYLVKILTLSDRQHCSQLLQTFLNTISWKM